jgi:acyl-CoA oxidase
VLNYSLVQYRLLPVLAQAFAFHYSELTSGKQEHPVSATLLLLLSFPADADGVNTVWTSAAGVSMYKQYNDNQDAMAGGDFSLLADTHASSSALKSLSTITAANAIETCRRACGGVYPQLSSSSG